MAPEFLARALQSLPRVAHPNLLVGFDTSDDAGVYKLSPDCALVQTVDFFTPIVDDPYTFGAIAAANSLSDVYAMGGVPLTALSILCYPGQGDEETLGAILRGGADKMAEADCLLLGGHSVADAEIKFGYSVTGTVHPDRVRANAHARVGDVVLLTKAIGTGVIATAAKKGLARAEYLEAAAASMLRLNREAGQAMEGLEVHGCTDITGFGLLGHGMELAEASGVTVRIEADRVPLLAGAREAVAQGAVPGGLRNNQKFAAAVVDMGEEIPEDLATLLYDPQTSGGLLLTLPEADAVAYQARYAAARIGFVLAREEKAIWVR